jgi:hypothetical protein
MRDSNPRGLAPNPLSKSAFGRSSTFRRHRDAATTGIATRHEPCTVANETKTETGVQPLAFETRWTGLEA